MPTITYVAHRRVDGRQSAGLPQVRTLVVNQVHKATFKVPHSLDTNYFQLDSDGTDMWFPVPMGAIAPIKFLRIKALTGDLMVRFMEQTDGHVLIKRGGWLTLWDCNLNIPDPACLAEVRNETGVTVDAEVFAGGGA